MSSRCKKPMRILVVIPAYNEENYLPATLEKNRAALSVGETLLLTHPLFILLTSKKRDSGETGMKMWCDDLKEK